MNDLTPQAQTLLAHARKEADRLNHNFIGTEHLILGLLELGEGTAFEVLTRDVDALSIKAAVERKVGRGPETKMMGGINYTPRVTTVFALAKEEVEKMQHLYMSVEHIILGIINHGNGAGFGILKELGFDLRKVKTEIIKILCPHHIELNAVSEVDEAFPWLREELSRKLKVSPHTEPIEINVVGVLVRVAPEVATCLTVYVSHCMKEGIALDVWTLGNLLLSIEKKPSS